MDYPFNLYNNVSYRQRSQTMQPTRGSDLGELTYSKQAQVHKYLHSQMDSIDSGRANYANVLHPSRPHQHVHTRSQSQHYYHTMCPSANDFNNYYNISNVPGGTTNIPTRSRHPSPIIEPPTIHNHIVHHIDSITIMQVCNELGYLDSPPAMPSSRNYTISASKECGLLYKIPFPQRRFTRGQFTHPFTGMSVAPNSLVTVLGPSKEDRSKFTVCYNDQHIDIPHQLTHVPEPTHWN